MDYDKKSHNKVIVARVFLIKRSHKMLSKHHLMIDCSDVDRQNRTTYSTYSKSNKSKKCMNYNFTALKQNPYILSF